MNLILSQKAQGANVEPLPETIESIGMAYAEQCKARLELGLPLDPFPELDQRRLDKLELSRMVCTYGPETVRKWVERISAYAHLGGL